MSYFSQILSRGFLWLRLLLGREDATSLAQLRNRRIGRGFVSSVGQKATALAVSVITVPLTVHYLGEERYGLWIAISSVTGWLALSDLGLSSSLGLAISTAFGRNDLESARRDIASAFYALCGIAVLLCVGFIAASPVVAWSAVFKVRGALAQAELYPAIAAAFMLFVLSFPLSVANRVLTSYQEFVTANWWLIAGNILTLAVLYFACRIGAGLPLLVICSSGAPLMIAAAMTVWLFCFAKPALAPIPSLFNLGRARELMSKGWWFFLTGVTWSINSQTDIFIISHFRGSIEVTPYAVAARLFSYASILQIVLAGSLVPAYAEANARGDATWILKTLRRHLWLSGITTAAICAGLYIGGPFIIHHWAGAAAIPSLSTLGWMAAWNVMLGVGYPIGSLLNGLGHTKGMTFYGGASAVLNVILSVWWIGRFGVAGVVAASAISFAVINLPLTITEARYRVKHVNAISHAVAT